jgi:hypothetical protein
MFRFGQILQRKKYCRKNHGQDPKSTNNCLSGYLSFLNPKKVHWIVTYRQCKIKFMVFLPLHKACFELAFAYL